MKRIQFLWKDLITLLIVIFISSAFIILGWALINNQVQLYPDFIVDILSEHGGYKTGELAIWWSIFLIGAALVLIINRLLKYKKHKTNSLPLSENKKTIIVIEGIACIANLAILILSGDVNLILTCISIIVFINYLVNPKRQKEGLILAIVSYYFLMSLSSVAIMLGFISTDIPKIILILGAGILDILILLIDTKKETLSKHLTILQIPIPLCLLLFIKNRYFYQGEEIRLTTPIVLQIIVYAVIFIMMTIMVISAIRGWKSSNKASLSKVISLATCVVIWICNSVTINTGLIAPEDMSHPAENVLGFQQTMLGQELYIDYSPTSGLFTWVIGGFLELIGGGYTYYWFAHSLFMAVVAALSMFILSKHIKKDDCLILSILLYSSASSIFYFQNYDRAVLILPALLILALPKLIKNSNNWLKVWIWLSLITGLYYPTYGIAVLGGGLPFAILQIIHMVRSGELKNKIRQPKFYVGWGICLLPILLLTPMLLRMFKFTKDYASQTMLADGQRVVGQEVASSFMPYLPGTLRELIYYLLQYLVLMVIVWFIVLLIRKFYLLKVKGKKKKLKELITTEFSIYSMSIVMILISYYSALVRFDDGLFVDRIGLLLGPVLGVLGFIVFLKYIRPNLISIIFAGIGLGLVYLTGGTPLEPINGSSITSRYQIGDNYTLIDNDMASKYPRLGTGFIEETVLAKYEQKQSSYKDILETDPDTQFIAAGGMSVYYVLDLKAYCQPRLQAVRDLNTHQCLLDAVRDQKVVVGTELERTEYHYYLYRELMTNDNYIYVEDYQSFLPRDLFNKMAEKYNIQATPKDQVPGYSNIMKRTSNTFGKSIESLESILVQQNTQIDITNEEQTDSDYTANLKFNRPINGLDGEFLYLSLEVDDDLMNRGRGLFDRLFEQQFINDDVKILIKWGEATDERLTVTVGDGKLLLPLGASPKWLTQEHDNLTIIVENIYRPVNLKEIRFYKLDETRLQF